MPAYWPIVEGWVESALEHADDLYSKEYIFASLMNRDMQLWLILKDDKPIACCVSKVNVYPIAKTICAFIVAGSDSDSWIDELTDTLSKFGKENGCSVIEAHGRMGWKKKLNGWKTTVNYSKEIQ